MAMSSAMCCLCFLMICIVFAFLSSSVYLAYQIFPEVGMVVNSQCNNPTPNWSGKIMGVRVWKDGFSGRNDTHSSYRDTTEDRRRRQLLHESGFDIENTERILESVTNRPNDPIIVWGSHHKTGTYVAQKAFSHMCKRMNWCCVFHVTRDSVNVIKEVLVSEPIKVLGHTQWIWNPKELGIKHYRFVHFYRMPYKKLLSGYRYHKDGAEAWCTSLKLNYTKACDFSSPEVVNGIVPYKKTLTQHNIRGGANFTEPKHQEIDKVQKLKAGSSQPSQMPRGAIAPLTRATIQDYCQSVHLCEPCCRREHEVDLAPTPMIVNTKPTSTIGKIFSGKLSNKTKTTTDNVASTPASLKKKLSKTADNKKTDNTPKSGKKTATTTSGSSKSKTVAATKTKVKAKAIAETSEAGSGLRQRVLKNDGGSIDGNYRSNNRLYAKNPQFIYDFQCENLGPMSDMSLTETLNQIPVVQGLRVEASIDYYETLRMARIFNETWADPYSLNIDLDSLMKDYSGTMRTIIAHLDLDLSPEEKTKLAKELDFYDIDSSPLYRFSMTNPLVNHIDTKSASDPTDYVGILKDDRVIEHVYSRIHEYMYWADKSHVSAAIAAAGAGSSNLEGSQSAAMVRIHKNKKGNDLW